MNKYSLILGGVISFCLLHPAASAEEPEAGVALTAGGDQVLLSIIDRAVATHPLIAAASASARAAGADVRAAQWRRFPSFSVEGLLLQEPINSLQAQIVVDQPIWTGGRVAGVINLAGARQNAALAAYDEAVLSVALGAAEAFFEVHRFRERAAILALSLDRHNQMVASIERRYAQDVSPLPDLELARSRALQIELQIHGVRAQESAAASRLREFVGDPFFVIGPMSPEPAVWPLLEDQSTTAQALSFSPLLKRLRFEAYGVGAEARIARAATMPQLSAQYSYSDTFGHRAGLVLKAQSDGGLSSFAAADAANQRVEASELQILAGERQVRDQLFSLLREYEAATAGLEGSAAASGSAQRVMESYIRQFTSGRRTWLDVMNALREATSAEIDALEVRVNAQSALVRILLLSGNWTPLSWDVAS